MKKVFITYHHENDQAYKDELIGLNGIYNIFHDFSVSTGDISDSLPTQTIRRIIRDDYLLNSSVTILLAGRETAGRKHVDWELKSSMIDGSINRKSGILVINLPSTGCEYYTATHNLEKETIYPDNSSWTTIESRQEYERRYPHMPARIIDNLMMPNAKISVVPWDRIARNPNHLKFLIDAASDDRLYCEYDLSRPMRMSNSPRIF